MTNPNSTGAARELPGRLAGFEDAADDPIDLMRRSRAPQHPAPAPAAAPPPERAAAPDPGPDPGAKGPQDRSRGSVVAIPLDLREQLRQMCDAEQRTRGEVIITAIEHAYPRLPELAAPQLFGGGLFGARRAAAQHHRDQQPLTQVSYRMRNGDFEVLDRLVQEIGAGSRAHLITLALQDYFGTT